LVDSGFGDVNKSPELVTRAYFLPVFADTGGYGESLEVGEVPKNHHEKVVGAENSIEYTGAGSRSW
jgi:hypothetical protein